MGKADQRRLEKARAAEKTEERKRVTLHVLAACDEARDRTLAAKRLTPSCGEGCAYCCSHEVPVSRAEGETLVAWLLEHKTPEELARIRERLASWRVAKACALLEDGRCIAYDVRPITCRNHLASSPPSQCAPGSKLEPVLILDVPRAAYPHVAELQALIRRQGSDYMASIHQLPEWLAHLLEVEREPWVTR